MPMNIDFLDILSEQLAEPDVSSPFALVPAIPANFPKTMRTAVDKGPKSWKTAFLVPDAQIGFRKYEDGTLDPFHSLTAINLLMQLANAVETEHSIDVIVILGDFLDLPQFGKWAKEPAFDGTANLTFQAGNSFISALRVIAPNAKIVYIDGNHDCRANKYVNLNAPAMSTLRQVGSDIPAISIPHLLNLESIGNVEHVSGYPADKYYLNKRLVCRHGTKAKSNGSTAQMYLSANHHESVIYGHSHRTELMYKTHDTSSGGVQNVAYSPGCICRIDGAVPSFNGGITTVGTPVKQYENWQQGVGVVFFKDDGDFDIKHIHIHDDRALFMGHEFTASV